MIDWERLKQAAALIEEARESLSLQTTKCDHCLFVKYENFDEHLVDKQLEAMAKKLRRFAQART